MNKTLIKAVGAVAAGPENQVTGEAAGVPIYITMKAPGFKSHPATR